MDVKVKIVPDELTKMAGMFKANKVGGFQKAVQYASAGMVSNIAFQLRPEVQNKIRKIFTIRTDSLVRAMVGYTPAKGNQPINAQEAAVFTREKERFTGWVEHEIGGKDKRKRVFSDEARGGSNDSVVKQKYRFKKSNRRVRTDDLLSKGSTEKALAYITDGMNKGRWPASMPIVVGEGHRDVEKGVYTYSPKSGKLTWIAATQESNTKRVEPKKFMKPTWWVFMAGRRYEGIFAKQMDRQLAMRVKWKSKRG